MKKFLRTRLLPAVVLMTWALSIATAQTPTDYLTMNKGELCVGVFYTQDTWDEYWEGTLKRVNANIGTLTRQTVLPMFALGLTDRINLMGALPWMKTEASGGQVKGAQGLQDLGLWVKARLIEKPLGPGDIGLLATVGLTTPASNYLPDYAPFSLGNGSTEGSLRGILQYSLKKGPYLRVLGGYHLRSNTTVERDYYYTTHGVYSDEVDMPNAVTYEAVLGTWILNNTLKIEATYDGMKSLGGFDIRRQDAGFPSNKMIFTRVGGGLKYEFPKPAGLSLFASGGMVLTGRNVGQSTFISGGVAYAFKVW